MSASGNAATRMATCRNCGKPIVVWEVPWHKETGLAPCDPAMVDPEAYLDIEADKYPVATPDYPDNDDDGAQRFAADESDWTAYPDNDDDGLERESAE